MPSLRPFLLALLLAPGLPAAGSQGVPDDGTTGPSASTSTLAAGTRIWGALHYLAVAADGTVFRPGSWGLAQESGLTLNLRSPAGAQFLGEFLLRREPGQDERSTSVVQQLSVRVSPLPSFTLIAGRQRLNWGTARFFSAIDTLEVRANPLDVRSFPAGVSGVKAVLVPEDWLGITVVVLPNDQLRWSRVGARFDFVAKDLDLDLGIGVVTYPYLDRAVQPGGPPARHGSAAVMSDGAWSSGALVLYEEVQLRRGRESGYRFPAMSAFESLGGQDELVFRAVAGATLDVEVGLTRTLTLVAEYLFNGEGLRRREALDFAANLEAWRSAGLPDGAEVPATLGGLGGFRRNYLSVAAQGLALRRDLLLGAGLIAGLDSGLVRLSGSLEWIPTQDTSVRFGYESFCSLRERSSHPSELDLIPFGQRASLSFTASY